MKKQKTKTQNFIIINLIAIFVLLFAFETKAEGRRFWEKSEIEKCRTLYNKKTPKAWEQAYESTCSELARNGNGEAQYFIGMIIKNSPKIPDYKAQAYSFFYVANENGEGRAKGEIAKIENKVDLKVAYEMLSNIYYSSIEKHRMAKDDNKSFEFLVKSSNLGSSSSQDDLCVVYALGFRGTFKFQKDYIRAYKWCYLANLDLKIRSNEKSQKVFARLKSLMTKSQILEGEKLAKEWIKNNPDLINNSYSKK
jgi:hypothetical protein